ncbi:MAG: DinB family protein [Chloroflexi bacterium]|nr:DinB family protein [Chloroflexota bacterium]
MSLKENVLKLLEIGYQEQLAFIERLTDDERAVVGTPDQWSAKNVLSHILAWNEDMLVRFEAIRQGQPLPPELEGEIDHQNLHLYEAHKDDSWATVRQIADTLYQRIVQFVQDSSEADLLDRAQMPPASSDSMRPWRWIVGSTVTHTLLHLADYDAKHRRQDHSTQIQEVLAAQLISMIDEPAWHGEVIYNLGCYYAISGQKEKAIGKILEALALRPDLLEWSKQDSDLNSIRDDARFQALYVAP